MSSTEKKTSQPVILTGDSGCEGCPAHNRANLLKLGVDMENFDFDLNWEVVSFIMSATVPNSTIVREEISKGADFSEMQTDLINSLITNQKLMIEEIKARGPDGSVRKLSPIVFTIQ